MKAKSKRTTVKRSPKKAKYDEEVIYKILDGEFLCHVSFIHNDHPVCIPTLYGRKGNLLYLHGATSSRLMKSIEGQEVCISITIVDGLVLARSAFHHSMNYRSVVVFGTPRKVQEADKNLALKVISDNMLPGRWEDSRLPNEKELKATVVLSMTLEESSAKIRSGGPIDDSKDYELDIWAGEIPVYRKYLPAVSDETGIPNLPLPGYLTNLKK